MRRSISKAIDARNKRQELLREPYRLIDRAYNVAAGVVKINTQNKYVHEVAKFKIMYLLKKAGYEAFSEVITDQGFRFDCYVPSQGWVIEVLHTETDREFREKKLRYMKKYDCLQFVQGYRAEEILKEEWKL